MLAVIGYHKKLAAIVAEENGCLDIICKTIHLAGVHQSCDSTIF